MLTLFKDLIYSSLAYALGYFVGFTGTLFLGSSFYKALEEESKAETTPPGAIDL